MSTKPTASLARWADVGGAFVTAPSSGLRDTGFQDGTPAEADLVNYEINQLYQWALYLSDGALTGDVSVAATVLSFVDFTYTANSATDQCAKVAHGLQSGDGPVRTSNSGGALPGGLAVATDYYAIRIDADHFQLATSRALALAGTPIQINLTTNGTGTQTLLHQAGTTSATSGRVSQVVQTSPIAIMPAGSTPTSAGSVERDIPSGADGFYAQVLIPAGRTIMGIRARVRDNAVNTISIRMVSNDTAAAGGVGSPPVSTIADVAGTTSSSSAHSGALEILEKTGVSVTTKPGVWYAVAVRTNGGTGNGLFHLEYDWV